jgi:hypothetical protein
MSESESEFGSDLEEEEGEGRDVFVDALEFA